MKKYTVFIKLILIISFVGIFIGILINNSNLKSSIELYDNNFKAINLENSELRNEIIAYRFDVEQLEYINDSIINTLNSTRKELGIKDKQLKQMQSIKTEIITRDSIYFRDTIFKESLVKLDTVLGDEWYKIKLHLEYPNKIGVDAKFDNEQYVIVHWKKVPVKPRKCKFAEWFTRKRKEITVDVISESPYVTTKKQRFVEIVK